MDDYADSYEPLITRQTYPSKIEIIDDFDYNLLEEGNFATGYTQLQQKNFVQLPTELVKPKIISKMKFTIIPTKTLEEEDEDEESESLPKQSAPEPQPLPKQSTSESQPKMKSSSESSSSSSSSSQSSSSDDEAMVMDMAAT